MKFGQVLKVWFLLPNICTCSWYLEASLSRWFNRFISFPSLLLIKLLSFALKRKKMFLKFYFKSYEGRICANKLRTDWASWSCSFRSSEICIWWNCLRSLFRSYWRCSSILFPLLTETCSKVKNNGRSWNAEYVALFSTFKCCLSFQKLSHLLLNFDMPLHGYL